MPLITQKSNSQLKVTQQHMTLCRATLLKVTEPAFFANKHLRKMQANRRTIIRQSCSLYNNNQIMKYILEVRKTTFDLGKIRKNKEKGRTEQQHLLAESPVHIHAAADPEAGLYVPWHQVDISPHCDGQSTQLPHDPSSQTCEIPQMSSTALGPTSKSAMKQ